MAVTRRKKDPEVEQERRERVAQHAVEELSRIEGEKLSEGLQRNAMRSGELTKQRRSQREEEKRRKAMEPLLDALRFVAKREHPRLKNAKLVVENLCGDDGRPSEEGRELIELVKRIRSFGLGTRGAEALTAEETARYEEIVGICCGEPGIFQRAREEAALKAEARELADKLKEQTLKQRPRWEEPGSVTLPRFAVLSWLVNDTEGTWTAADIGALVILLGCFENRDAGPVANARFEEVNGEQVLVIAGGVGADLRFAGFIGGDSVDPSLSGHVRLRPALVTLARNKWFVVERSTSETRIKLGERALKLREGRAAA